MTDPVKVHPGLKNADRRATYHLGHYRINFDDQPVTFQLHANLCEEPSCLCDNLQIALVAEGATFGAWYSSEHVWTDNEGGPIPQEVADLLGIIEDTDNFRERYSHLVYLRRKQVLAEAGRLDDPFEILLPGELAETAEEGIAGSVSLAVDGKISEWRYSLELCADPECYCRELFLVLPELPAVFLIGDNDRWLPVDHDGDAAIPLMNQLREKLTASPRFNALVVALRQERRLQNYHRFVRLYPEKAGISV